MAYALKNNCLKANMFASLEIATTNKQSNNQFPLKFEEIGHDITNYKATAVSREGIYIYRYY